MGLFWFRESQGNDGADESGTNYTTMDRATKDKYVESAMRNGDQVEDNSESSRVPIVGEINVDTKTTTFFGTTRGYADRPGNVDMVVLDEDSVGASYPTKKHAPGY
jgi:hypothetical protein